MKILLSPLYYRRSFCKNCVRAFYKEDSDHWIWEHEFERLPPLGRFDRDEGFTPDYPVLLMFDEFAVDESAHERLVSDDAPWWLGSWPEVARALSAEGCLAPVDLKPALRSTAAKRGGMLRSDMREPGAWQEAMGYYSSLMANADQALGERLSGVSDMAWEHADFLPGVSGRDGEGHYLPALLTDDLSADEYPAHHDMHDQALGELRNQLREANAAVAVSQALGMAPMIWAPYREYVDAKINKATDSMRAALEREDSARLFFDISFPRYRPDSAKEFLRLRSDRRVVRLRGEIVQAARSGDAVDPEYPQRTMEEVIGLKDRAGQARNIAAWAATTIGLTAGAVPGVAAALATTVISRHVEKVQREKWDWFYLISDGTGHS